MPNDAVSKGDIFLGLTERMAPHVTVLDDFRSKLSWCDLLPFLYIQQVSKPLATDTGYKSRNRFVRAGEHGNSFTLIKS